MFIKISSKLKNSNNIIGIWVTILLYICIVFFNLYTRNGNEINNKTAPKNKIESKNNKEGFTWSQDTIYNFVRTQLTKTPQVLFDTNMIQQQVSEEDAKNFLKSSEIFCLKLL